MTEYITIQPFDQHPNEQYIDRLSNHLFDYVMPTLSPTGWMVLCFIIRKTTGWNKESDQLSIGDIKAGTGIKSAHTVIKAIGELEEKEYILSKRNPNTRKSNTYTLNTTAKIAIETTAKNAVVDSSTVNNALETTAKNAVEKPLTTAKNAHTKEQYLKDKEKENARAHEGADPLADIFNLQGEQSDFTGSNPEDQYFTYRDEFLSTYQQMTGSYPDDVAKDAIAELIEGGEVTPEIWSRAWRETKLNYQSRIEGRVPLARVIEVAQHGGDYEKWRAWKFPENGSNGRDSPHSNVKVNVSGSIEKGFNL